MSKNNDNDSSFNEENDESKRKKAEFNDFLKNVIRAMSGDITNFEDKYGKPDSVEYYEEDGVYFEKKKWKVNGGEVVEVTGSSKPFNERKLTLEEQLAEAIQHEDYEEAAKLRDEIANKEK